MLQEWWWNDDICFSNKLTDLISKRPKINSTFFYRREIIPDGSSIFQFSKKENSEKGKYVGMSKWIFTKENDNDHIFLRLCLFCFVFVLQTGSCYVVQANLDLSPPSLVS
jgi:hypothetical protein